MRIIFSILLLLSACGCVSNSLVDADANHAECLVCKKNVDLACVDVNVESQTPRADYNGKTYYFCSDDCRDAFVKNPQKYLSQK